MKLLLLLSSFTFVLCFNSCQSSRLPNKKLDKIIRDRMTTVFNNYAADAVHNRAASIAREVGLDSLQYVALTEITQWEYLIQPKRDSVLEFSTSTYFSKEDKAAICDCIEKKNSDRICEKLVTPIAEKVGEEADNLLGPLEWDMTDIVLEKGWVPSNVTPENCAPLQSGIFYYFTPVQKKRVDVERYKGGQIETIGSETSRYEVIWIDYNHYRLIEIESKEGFDVTVEVVQVYPTHYIFKLKLPFTTAGKENYIMGRINRAEKKS